MLGGTVRVARPTVRGMPSSSTCTVATGGVASHASGHVVDDRAGPFELRRRRPLLSPQRRSRNGHAEMRALTARGGERTAVQLAPGKLDERIGRPLGRNPFIAGQWPGEGVDGGAKSGAAFWIKKPVQRETAVQPLGEVQTATRVHRVGIR